MVIFTARQYYGRSSLILGEMEITYPKGIPQGNTSRCFAISGKAPLRNDQFKLLFTAPFFEYSFHNNMVLLALHRFRRVMQGSTYKGQVELSSAGGG